MKFGIMFFPHQAQEQQARSGIYHLLFEVAKFADTHDFSSIWTPERHFDEFGGIFPNPSVTSAALAVMTQNIRIMAGSLVSPLHDAVRIAEDWEVIDNLSNGRAAISFGSGWNVNDFIFFPDNYEKRKAIMNEQIQLIQKLWRGDSIVRTNSFGKDVAISTFPRPVQHTLPIWITTSGSPATFVQAGRLGTNLLTHMIGQDLPTLAKNIQAYRAARKAHGFDPLDGTVSLMLHTFVGKDPSIVREKVKQPFKEYLRSAVLLENKAAQGGGTISGGHQVPSQNIPDFMLEELLEITFDRYYSNAALLGTPDTCAPLITQLREIGVDEIACLIDFGPTEGDIIASLGDLNTLRVRFSEA